MLAEATGNPQFIRLLEFLEQYLKDAMRVTRANEAQRADFSEQVSGEHRAIFEAVEARDPATARRVAVRHMLQGDRRLQRAGVLKTPVKKPGKKGLP